jgi:hypothetical protein
LERDVSTKFLILTFDKRRLMRRLGDTWVPLASPTHSHCLPTYPCTNWE